MEERIELLADAPEQEERKRGISVSIIVSIVVHSLLLIWFFVFYHPVSKDAKPAPTQILRYVELMKQSPDFVEAPGKHLDKAPLNAPYSDANRKASSPKPTGDQRTNRPGDGGMIFTPPSGANGDGRPLQRTQPQQPPPPQNPNQQLASNDAAQQPATSPTFRYNPNQQPAKGPSSAPIDWKSAIQEVGKSVSPNSGSGPEGPNLGQGGGEKGFADNGPLSFETQWYDWGAYAESMVSKIRVNWYNNMPELIRIGVKGVVTIRFLIHRDGSITEVTIIKGSGVPPYDFAAKKAIELSSPLNPLPKDFPNPSEHVTCVFYYNLEPARN